MNQAYLDILTIFAAAATKTSEVCLGTAIVQTYPAHTLALAQQASKAAISCEVEL
jgi:alkanesulfonate monooxygenase SsuD/methylene tetrahydromethanopterin reductase-like flavin-dependent oxidoreductase (luciferase family)